MWIILFAVSILMFFLIIRYIFIPLIRFVLKHFLMLIGLAFVLFLIPGIIDEGIAVIVIIILALASSGSSSGYSDSGYDHYILNKRSKVAHRYFSDSANSVSEKNRREIFATRSELREKGYRIKDE